MNSSFLKYLLIVTVCMSGGSVSFSALAADESLLDVLERPTSTVFPVYTYPVMPTLPQQQIVPTMPAPVLPVPTVVTIPTILPPIPAVMPMVEISQKTCEMLRPVTVLGTRNQAVTAIQDVLRSEGYFNQESTGYYGSVTAQSVRSFQAAYGIRTTGMVGDLTYKKLVERCIEGIFKQNPGAGSMIEPQAPIVGQIPVQVVPPIQIPQNQLSQAQPTQPVNQTATFPTAYAAPLPTQPTLPASAAPLPPAPFATPSSDDLSEAETYGINRSRAMEPASTCTAEVLTGDIEPQAGGDRDVDIWDLLQITRNYNKSVNLSTNTRADIVADGIVDFKDLVIVVQQFSRRACN